MTGTLAHRALALVLAFGLLAVGAWAAGRHATADIALAANQTVRIVDGPDPRAFGYQPATITVAVGDTVTWSNTGALQHTVTSETGAFDSGLIAPGQSFTQTFQTPGTYNYFCTLHPNMRGTVTVSVPSGQATPGPSAIPTPSVQATSTYTGSPAIQLVIDEPRPGGRLFGPSIVRGWAIDVTTAGGTGIDQVQVFLDGDRTSGQLIGTANYGVARSDVAQALNNQAALNAGYQLSFDATQLRPGRHTLTVAARSPANGVGQRTIQFVVGPELCVQADAQVIPAPGGPSPFGPGVPPFGPGLPPYGPGVPPFGPGAPGGLAVQVNVRVTAFGQGVPGAQVTMGGVQFPPTGPDGFTTQTIPFSQVQPNGLVGRVTATWQDVTAEADVYVYNYY